MVKSINKKLTKMKNTLKNVPKDEVSKVKENEKIIDIEKKQGSGLKILKLNQMLTQQITNYFSSIKSRKQF